MNHPYWMDDDAPQPPTTRAETIARIVLAIAAFALLIGGLLLTSQF